MIGVRKEGTTQRTEELLSAEGVQRRSGDAAKAPAGAAVTCRGICKAFLPAGRGRRPFVALEDVDLAIADGEFVTILGPSGCGKTTLLNIMAGMDSATRGTVTFAETIRRKAYLFQRDTLLPWRNATRNVELGMTGRGLTRAERRAEAHEWLRLVGLDGFEHAFPSQLSGGMRRRVALATVFAHAPEILFMDEPFGSVDAQTRMQLQGELLKLCEGDGRTVIFVTHDIEEALLLSDRVIVMSGKPGRIIDDFRVGMPRPRSLDAIRFDTEVSKMAQRIWHELASVPVESDA
jgi:sulfonate transport system ATP-binding protein